MKILELALGDALLRLELDSDRLHSLGPVEIDGTPLRNVSTRWLPWFDAFEGEVFNRFRFEGMEVRSNSTVLHTTAIADNDYPFRERRDASGDLCFRNANWDAQPVEAQFDICFQEAREAIDGREFHGFRYWFEYSGDTPIHRLVDRQTWEVGGTVEDLNLVCRNWLTPPRVRLSRDVEYSTVGLDKWSTLLPGNLWARWSLLPAFDFQYSNSGVLLAWFDEVSLIRTVIESNRGEDALRVLDMHLFEQSTRVATNAKTVLFCPDILDDSDAMNLWTRVHDLESDKASAQFSLPEEEPPAIVFSHNVWKNIRFDSTYESVVEIASEFGADYLFIDPVWEHQQAWRESVEEAIPVETQKGTIFEKWRHDSMCSTLDFEVAQIHGGEIELKNLCQRAAQKDLKILSWMASHLSPNSVLMNEENLAAKESGRHPDTGYAQSCWPISAHSPVWAKMREQLLGVCERTGLKGFLWDSFSNLGWWQLDYASGTMRPQVQETMELYRDLENAGLYLMPEAVVSFSSHSCCGLHGGNVYDGEALGYSYNTNISLQWNDVEHANAILRGEEPLDLFFRSLAHKRSSSYTFHTIPREEWHPESEKQIKQALNLYKRTRHLMRKRTVLPDDAGVLWQSDSQRVLWCFTSHARDDGAWTDAESGEQTALLERGRVYCGT